MMLPCEIDVDVGEIDGRVVVFASCALHFSGVFM